MSLECDLLPDRPPVPPDEPPAATERATRRRFASRRKHEWLRFEGDALFCEPDIVFDLSTARKSRRNDTKSQRLRRHIAGDFLEHHLDLMAHLRELDPERLRRLDRAA